MRGALTFFVIFFGVLVFIAWGAFAWDEKSGESIARFGDSFGVVSACVSALGFAAVCVTLHIEAGRRRKDSAGQEEAQNLLKLSIEAQTRSADSLTKQIKIMGMTAQLAALTELVTKSERILANRNHHQIASYTLDQLKAETVRNPSHTENGTEFRKLYKHRMLFEQIFEQLSLAAAS